MSNDLLVIIGAALIIIVFVGVQNLFERRCPKCKSFFGPMETSKDNLGDLLPPNDRYTYKKSYYCSNCNNRWTKIVVEDPSS